MKKLTLIFRGCCIFEMTTNDSVAVLRRRYMTAKVINENDDGIEIAFGSID